MTTVSWTTQFLSNFCSYNVSNFMKNIFFLMIDLTTANAYAEHKKCLVFLYQPSKMYSHEVFHIDQLELAGTVKASFIGWSEKQETQMKFNF